MTDLYLGNRIVKDIYVGDKLISQVFKGSQRIYSKLNPDDIIFQKSVAGTYNLDIITDGIYEVYCIGAGAGGGSGRKTRKSGSSIIIKNCTLTGGSGSGFIGEIELNRGNYQIVVGKGSNNAGKKVNGNYTINAGGNSSIGNIVISYGASGAVASGSIYTYNYSKSTGGQAPTINTEIISSTLNTAGNNGVHYDGTGHKDGGASVYNGYGAGGSANYDDYAYNGTDGYVKLVFKRFKENNNG